MDSQAAIYGEELGRGFWRCLVMVEQKVVEARTRTEFGIQKTVILVHTESQCFLRIVFARPLGHDAASDRKQAQRLGVASLR